MPKVKFVCIQSFSSEDPDHPAKSLLHNDISKRTWLCRSGEPKCSVVIQLGHAVIISSVQIGVNHAAFVEVLVGRSENPDDYKVLIPSSVFVPPAESRRGERVARVRSFAGEQLAAARAERWDRVKLVCSQPYNTRCKYGLSFVDIFTPEDSEPATSTTPIAPVASAAPAPPAAPAAPAPAAALAAPFAHLFNIDAKSSDDEDTFKPGELFAKHRMSAGSQNTDAQIRHATSQVLNNLPGSTSKLVKTPIVKDKTRGKAASPAREPAQRHRDDILYNLDDTKPNTKIDKVIKRHEEEKKKNEKKPETNREKIKPETSKNCTNDVDKKQPKTNGDRIKDEDRKERVKDTGSDRNKKGDSHSRNKEVTNKRESTSDNSNSKESSRESKKRQHSDDRSGDNPAKRLRAGPASAAPHTLLADVVFALSGYENPRRAAVRDAALALGAQYARDWAPGCTHLVCAFPNTPKLRAVRAAAAGAVAVTAEWVERCRAERRRLPWQWFATEPHRRVARPEEEEVEAEEECDTDDEIEKVLQQQKKENPSSRSPKKYQNVSNTSSASDVEYVKDERFKGSVTLSDSDGGATDEDDVVNSQVRIDSSKPLPDFFDGFTFMVHESVAGTFDVELLKRYVKAYGGEVLEPKRIDADTTVNFVLCCDVKEAPRGAAAVRPDWVWRCHDKRKLCSHKKYSLD